METKKKKRRLYIDKAEFHREMIKYNAQPPGNRKISDYIGRCILDICYELSKRSNFAGYTYIDEMRSDGIENCVMAVDSYDIKNPKMNPFWYFSKIAFYAFVRRIQAEKKQSYIKHKNVQNYYLQGKLEDVEANELSDKVIGDFEDKQREIKLRKVKNV